MSLRDAPDRAQLDLLARFDGFTVAPEHDDQRLTGQLGRVRALMADGAWRTLGEIVAAAGGSEAGCSARLRDLRKRRHGAHTVERQRRGGPSAGIFEYRLVSEGEGQP